MYEYNGICTSCGEITFGGVEPDAHGYCCEYCGSESVVGMELAILMGLASPEDFEE